MEADPGLRRRKTILIHASSTSDHIFPHLDHTFAISFSSPLRPRAVTAAGTQQNERVRAGRVSVVGRISSPEDWKEHSRRDHIAPEPADGAACVTVNPGRPRPFRGATWRAFCWGTEMSMHSRSLRTAAEGELKIHAERQGGTKWREGGRKRGTQGGTKGRRQWTSHLFRSSEENIFVLWENCSWVSNWKLDGRAAVKLKLRSARPSKFQFES